MLLVCAIGLHFNKSTDCERIVSLPTFEDCFKNYFLEFVFIWSSNLIPNCKFCSVGHYVKIAIKICVDNLKFAYCWNKGFISICLNNVDLLPSNNDVKFRVVIHICRVDSYSKTANIPWCKTIYMCIFANYSFAVRV